MKRYLVSIVNILVLLGKGAGDGEVTVFTLREEA